MRCHLVLTRFNLRLPGQARDKHDQAVADEAWLRHRFLLFERYCLPSVAHQTVQDFRWLVLFADDTPAHWRQHLDSLRTRCPQLEAHFLATADIAGLVNRLVPADCRELITTRIDNDDAYHHEALERIRKATASQAGPVLIRFRFGLNYDGQRALVISHRNNPFASLRELREDASQPFRTIHCDIPHGHLDRLAPALRISEQPYWLTVVHERNLVNRRPDEGRRHDLRRPKEWLKWARRHLLKPITERLRRLAWAPALRRHYDAQRIESDFL